MKKLYCLFICSIFIVVSKGVFSQSESLIKYDDLTFKNDSEKIIFLKCNESKDADDVFDLLFTSYDKSRSADKASALQRINNCVSYLKAEIADKSDVKKVKITYDYVHKQFLKVYKLKNSFIDIFETGEYNCVSASALYALIFKKMSVPYQIKETPEHIYLLAYPNSSKILIETTSPTNGYYQFSNTFVSNFVASLYESKIISKEEHQSIPVNELFNTHYFTSEDISLIALSGFQYSNFAIYSLENNDFKNANEEIKKAYFLFQGEKHKYILKSTITALLDKNGYDDPDNIKNLVVLCRFNNLKEK